MPSAHTPADRAWRGRTVLACAVVALAVIAAAAVRLDWSQGPAVALGQLAGVAAPVAVLALLLWGAAALAGRKG